MKKVHWVLIVSIVFFLLLGFYLGWLDNGPRFNHSDIKNYQECVDAGGKTNEDQLRIQDTCEYKGEIFGGANI